jgi:hypothetical protein
MKKGNEKIVGKSIFISMYDDVNVDNILDYLGDGSYEDIEDVEWGEGDQNDDEYAIEFKVVAVHKRKVTIEKVQ